MRLLLLALGLAALPARAETAGKFACNLKALTPEQRTAHEALTGRLFKSVETRREIPSGFELRVDSKKMSIVELATWVDDERRCCPFLGLAIEKEPQNGPLWLRLTGPEGVKDFLRAEMGG